MTKISLLTGVLILFIGCSWPKVKIAGDEYIIVLPPHGGNVAIPPKSTEDSVSGSTSDSKGVKPQKADNGNKPLTLPSPLRGEE